MRNNESYKQSKFQSASFTRDGIFNFYNIHNCDEENPYVILHSRHQHQFSLNVWPEINDKLLIGPLFLDGKLKGTKYVDFMSTRLHEILEEVTVDIRLRMRFMRDGAPPHFIGVTKRPLNQNFANKWIGREGPIPWPDRSPNLKQLDMIREDI